MGSCFDPSAGPGPPGSSPNRCGSPPAHIVLLQSSDPARRMELTNEIANEHLLAHDAAISVSALGALPFSTLFIRSKWSRRANSRIREIPITQVRAADRRRKLPGPSQRQPSDNQLVLSIHRPGLQSPAAIDPQDLAGP